MSRSGVVSRVELARKLEVSVDTLRYQERKGTFTATKKIDGAGRPMMFYSLKEVRKAFRFYTGKGYAYKC